jgi:urea transporter
MRLTGTSYGERRCNLRYRSSSDEVQILRGLKWMLPREKRELPGTGTASRVWSDLAKKNPVVGYFDLTLRGASQVFFQSNPLSGLIMLAGIFWGACSAGNLNVAYAGVVGLIVSTLMAVWLDVDRPSLEQGLFGFNGILTGIAVATFLANHPLMWAYLIVGAAVSTIVTLAVANVVKTWGVPGSTAPFVFTTWLLLLGAYSFANISVTAMGPPALRVAATADSLPLSTYSLLGILSKNISQVYLIEDVPAGILFLIAIGINSVRGAAFAVIGSMVSLGTALVFGANATAIASGLFGFSAVLTAMAVGAVFERPSFRGTLYAILATIFTVVAQAALGAAVSPFGIPTLTFPYLLTMWLFLLPKLGMAPHPHHLPIMNGVLTTR